METPILLSIIQITVGILTLLVAIMIGFQVWNYFTFEGRMEKKMDEKVSGVEVKLSEDIKDNINIASVNHSLQLVINYCLQERINMSISYFYSAFLTMRLVRDPMNKEECAKSILNSLNNLLESIPQVRRMAIIEQSDKDNLREVLDDPIIRQYIGDRHVYIKMTDEIMDQAIKKYEEFRAIRKFSSN